MFEPRKWEREKIKTYETIKFIGRKKSNDRLLNEQGAKFQISHTLMPIYAAKSFRLERKYTIKPTGGSPAFRQTLTKELLFFQGQTVAIPVLHLAQDSSRRLQKHGAENASRK